MGAVSNSEKFGFEKINFDHTYSAPTPIPYMSAMQASGYEILEHASPVLQRLVDFVRIQIGRPPRVLDVGCSYGVSTWMLRYGYSLQELYEHYTSHSGLAENAIALQAVDRQQQATLEVARQLHVIGYDSSRSAIRYALDAGLLDEGVLHHSGNSLRNSMDVDIVVSTGAIGYVSSVDFAEILERCSSKNVWIANFALESVSYATYSAAIEDFGLTTIMADHRYPQRKIARTEMVEPRARQSTLDENPRRTALHYARLYLSARDSSTLPGLCTAIVRGPRPLRADG